MILPSPPTVPPPHRFLRNGVLLPPRSDSTANCVLATGNRKVEIEFSRISFHQTGGSQLLRLSSSHHLLLHNNVVPERRMWRRSLIYEGPRRLINPLPQHTHTHTQKKKRANLGVSIISA